MYSKKGIKRVEIIHKRIEFIFNIINEKQSIVRALEDEQNSKAAILMHLVSIAEQFDKLIKNADLDILSNFSSEDIKGSYELRNFIAHDYEGVDLYVVERVIRERLPKIYQTTKKILKEGLK